MKILIGIIAAAVFVVLLVQAGVLSVSPRAVDLAHTVQGQVQQDVRQAQGVRP